jgi:hypothetical protein
MTGGWLLSAVLIAPNLIWALMPMSKQGFVPDGEHGTLRWLEHGARVGVFALPCFYGFHRETTAEQLALAISVVAVTAYYLAWARYFLRGRRYDLLFRAAGPIPVPLALAPIIALAAGSVALHSLPLAVATLAFAVLHLRSSIHLARELPAS